MMRAALAISVLLTAGSTFGCNAIAGIDEAQLDPTLDDTSSGSGGGSGSGGSGSIDDKAIEPEDGCGDDLLLDEALIQGCLMRVSCDPLLPPYTMSTCVTFARQEVSASELCTMEATSCSEIDECLLRRYIDSAEICDGVSSEWACDGNVAVRCNTDRPYQVDCEALDADCVEGSNSTLAGVGGCTPRNSSVDCSTASEGESFCSDTEIHFCSDGGTRGFDCASRGDVCVETVAGQAYCGREVTTCETPGEGACVEGGIGYCFDDGTFDFFDCSVAGLSCKLENDGEDAHCLADGCNSDDICEEQCLDGTHLQYCQGGSPVSVDCTAFGFGSCGSGEYSDGSTYAVCLTASAEDSCCSLEDPCDFADDGDCDCPNQPWDVNDCTDFGF